MSVLMWTVVVPVKAAELGKTRLSGTLTAADRVALVRAMACDTLTAAVGADPVARVVVVTGDAAVARAALALTGADVEVLGEPVPGGLDAAVTAGVARARELAPDDGVAVLLGDLPALRADELAALLDAASATARAFVADATGSGTSVLTARRGADLRPHFGAGSAAAHEREGHVRLDVTAGSGARQDVDVAGDLEAVARLGVGPCTREVLARVGSVRVA